MMACHFLLALRASRQIQIAPGSPGTLTNNLVARVTATYLPRKTQACSSLGILPEQRDQGKLACSPAYSSPSKIVNHPSSLIHAFTRMAMSVPTAAIVSKSTALCLPKSGMHRHASAILIAAP